MLSTVVRPRITPADLREAIRGITAARQLLEDDVEVISDRIFAHIIGHKMPRWCVMRLEWDNMMKYGTGNAINFDALRGNLSGVNAPNDSGKSSIIDILMFALFGESIRATKHTIERIDKQPADRSWISVCIRVQESTGPIMYRVDRVVKSGRNAQCAVYAADGTPRDDPSSAHEDRGGAHARRMQPPAWTLQEWGTSVQIQKKLTGIIGDAGLFKALAISSPGVVGLCNCDYVDRLYLFSNMFGFSGLVGGGPRDATSTARRAELQNRRSSLHGELVGLSQAGKGVDTTMGMTGSEMEWLEEKFRRVDAREVITRVRGEMAGTSRPRDATVVYSEYERVVGDLRREISSCSNDFRWNDECAECAHNRQLCAPGGGIGNATHADLIERLSAERDRLAAEYGVSRKADQMRLELAYAEKYLVWTTLRGSAGAGRIAEISAEIAGIDNELRLDDLYHEIILDGGIARLLTEWYIGGVIGQANAILGAMQCPFVLGHSLVGVGGEVGLKLTSRDPSGAVVPLELGGGFQRFACGLAIRAAILRYNGGPDMLIVDEGFDCMDVVNRFKCIDTFPVLVRIFKVFMVVSQLENIRALLRAEYTLTVAVLVGVSTVRNCPGQLCIPPKKLRGK